MSSILNVGIRRLGRALFILAVLLDGAAQTDAATLNVSWSAPTTNANGTPLTDLAGYRVYIGTSSPACPGGPSHAVASTTASPDGGDTVSSRITSLTASATYFVRVTAVDDSGNESGCSPQVSGVARSDIAVSPTTTVSFGTLATGSAADRTFTVQNTSTAAVSGTASVGAPFSIVSGGSFSLAPGASQAIVARFQPTTSGTFAGNVNFTVDGDTLSRTLSGAATGSDAPAPPQGGACIITPTPSALAFSHPVGGPLPSPQSIRVVTSDASPWRTFDSGFYDAPTCAGGADCGSGQTTTVQPMPTTLTRPAGTYSYPLEITAGPNCPKVTVPVVLTVGSQASPPPPSAPPAATGSLQVVITDPTAGATVAGSDTAVVWVEGTSGSSNTFTLSVDGRVTGTETTSARGPVALPWTSIPNGAHLVTASVRDAAGNTGSASITVNVAGSSATGPPPPPPPPPPPTDTLSVAVTQPTEGTTVGGIVWVVLWVDGSSGSSNTFTLSVDGATVGSETTSARGPVSIPWTTSVSNGTHTLTAVVRDAAGNTGRSSVSVTVRN